MYGPGIVGSCRTDWVREHDRRRTPAGAKARSITHRRPHCSLPRRLWPAPRPAGGEMKAIGRTRLERPGHECRIGCDKADSGDIAAVMLLETSVREISTDSGRDARGGIGASMLSLATLLLWTAAPLQAEVARLETSTDTERNGRELQKQIDELSDSVTERSRMLVRDDVLFATGTAELDGMSRAHLRELANFLIRYPSHIAIIEGHTDSAGTDEANHVLSQRRADAVKSYLVRRGVDPKRLLAFGKGEELPVADNGSAQGRQQNRRAAVTVENSSVPRDYRE